MSSSVPILPSELRDRYRIVCTLGTGAFGIVREVHDTELDRSLALKQARPGQGFTAFDLERFVQEGKILASLTHPHLLRIYQAGEAEGNPWLLTELLKGRSLDEPPPPKDLLGYILALASALEALHRVNVVHRDIKPANLFLTKENRPVLLDLGLARPFVDQGLTETGALVGTPAYMAPELFRGEEFTAAADWFALGVSLFCLAENRLPYGNHDLLAGLAGKPLPPLKFQKLPEGHPLRSLASGLMASAPDSRPSSVRALQALLEAEETPPSSSQILVSVPIQASSAQPLVPRFALAVLAASALAASWFVTPSRNPPPPPSESSPKSLFVTPPESLDKLATRFEIMLPVQNASAAQKLLRVRELTDAAFLPRWRRYLGGIRDWLLAAELQAVDDPSGANEATFEGRLTDQSGGRTLMRLAYRIPLAVERRVMLTVDAALQQLLAGPKHELSGLLSQHRIRLINHQKGLEKATNEWFQALPPSLQKRRLARFLWWTWTFDSLEQDHVDRTRELTGKLLPAYQGTPLMPLVLETTGRYLRNKDRLEQVPCKDRLAWAETFAAALRRFQVETESTNTHGLPYIEEIASNACLSTNR